MERAETLHSRGDHALDVTLDADVPHHGERPPAPAFDQARGLGRGRLVDVGHHDPGTLLGEQACPLTALAHPRAGDESHLLLEPHIRSKFRASSQLVTTLSRASSSSRAVWR